MLIHNCPIGRLLHLATNPDILTIFIQAFREDTLALQSILELGIGAQASVSPGSHIQQHSPPESPAVSTRAIFSTGNCDPPRRTCALLPLCMAEDVCIIDGQKHMTQAGNPGRVIGQNR